MAILRELTFPLVALRAIVNVVTVGAYNVSYGL